MKLRFECRKFCIVLLFYLHDLEKFSALVALSNIFMTDLHHIKNLVKNHFFDKNEHLQLGDFSPFPEPQEGFLGDFVSKSNTVLFF